MTTFTVNIEDPKSEKAVKAFLDALELNYKVKYSSTSDRLLSRKEKEVYNSLKNSLNEIKKWENGEIELRDAKDLLNEL